MSRFQFQTVRDGKQEWRRGWDLNPRYPLRYVRFRGGSFQPLTHLSASDKSSVDTLLARSWTAAPRSLAHQRCRQRRSKLRLYARRFLKNVCSNSALRPAKTPLLTSSLWFSCGWFRTRMTECPAPAFGSSEP